MAFALFCFGSAFNNFRLFNQPVVRCPNVSDFGRLYL